MASLTKNRNTPERMLKARGYPIAAGAHVFAGGLAVLDAPNYAEPGSTATGKKAVGVFTEEYDNTLGGDGAEVVEVERGCFQFGNSAAADEITDADIGALCYIVDDQTVAKTDGTGTRSIAGIVDGVDANGVWVVVDPTSGAEL